MKKIIAVLLAAVLAFGCSAIAFASYAFQYCGATFDSSAERSAHEVECGKNTRLVCACGMVFEDADAYNKHIADCPDYQALKTTESTTVSPFFEGVTLKYLLDLLVDTLDINAAQWDNIEDVVIRLIDLVENLGSAIVSSADVMGAVDDLDSKVGNIGLADDVLQYVESIIASIRQKIKDFYAGNTETEVQTEAAEPADTGSDSTMGIAAFSAVSLAATAAYICLKKKNK